MLLASSCLSLLRTVAQAGLPVLLKVKEPAGGQRYEKQERRRDAGGTKTNGKMRRERDAACVLASLLRTVAQEGLRVLLKRQRCRPEALRSSGQASGTKTKSKRRRGAMLLASSFEVVATWGTGRIACATKVQRAGRMPALRAAKASAAATN